MEAKAPTLHLPKRYSFRRLEFWPEGGLIQLEDKDTGELLVMTRRTALLRIKAINETIHFWPHVSDREEHHKLVSDMISCVKDAKAQGDPTDPEIIERKVRELRRSRKAKILLPGGSIPGIEIPKLTKTGLGDTSQIELIPTIKITGSS